ncbi:MAG: hypothetical protein OHK0026_09180 [Rhodocyclaceae bacterium]
MSALCSKDGSALTNSKAPRSSERLTVAADFGADMGMGPDEWCRPAEKGGVTQTGRRERGLRQRVTRGCRVPVATPTLGWPHTVTVPVPAG